MDIKRIYIQGAGTMGNGIAQVSAQAGYDVVMMDLSAEFVQKGMDTIGKSLQKMVEKGRMKAEDKSAILSRIKPATDIKEAKDADLVIEAVFEDLEVKKKVFKALDEVCPPHAILASNTSALPIAAMAASTKRPDKVLGLHFMNPVPLMKGVEIIRAITTSDETMADALRRGGEEGVHARRPWHLPLDEEVARDGHPRRGGQGPPERLPRHRREPGEVAESQRGRGEGVRGVPGRADTQKTIGMFGVEKFGAPLFFPDAGKKVEDLGR